MVTIRVKIITSFIEKTQGLIGKKTCEPIFLQTRFGIHTFGVKFPIDVAILDNNNCIVKLITVKPNQLFFWNPCFSRVLELPEGTIKNKQLHIGEKLELVFSKE